MRFIIARYQENTDWAQGLDHTIIQKGVDMPNLGREPASYLLYILNNYEKLDREYVFCQGNPLDHDPNFLENVKTSNYYGKIYASDMEGRPNDANIPMKEALEVIGAPEKQEFLFKAGCQFKLTAEEIRKVPYETYAKLFALMFYGRVPWAFERLVQVLYPTLQL